MVAYYCVSCGNRLHCTPGDTVAVCSSCDIRQPVPVRLPISAVERYTHICSLLRNKKREEATHETASLLREYPEEPSLHWLTVLTQYGLDFVRSSAVTQEKKQAFNHSDTVNQFREADCIPGETVKAEAGEREAQHLRYQDLLETEEKRLLLDNLKKTAAFPDEARKRRFLRRRNRKIRTGLAALFLFCSLSSAVILLFLYFILPFASYREAGRLLKQGDTVGARAIYEELGDFLHSAEYVHNIDSAPGALETPNNFAS